MKKATYAELDLPRCTLTYGVSPCEAELGVTGNFKCYNSPASCQDPQNFDKEIQVVRFVLSSAYNPIEIYAIPNIEKVDLDPQKLSVGENLGKRETGSVTFSNHKFNDVLFDKYISDRGFNPHNQGTFWDKFDARYPNIEGYEFRLLYGDWDFNSDLIEFTTYNYIAKKGTISSNGKKYILEFQDALTAIEGGKTLYPFPSNGVLSAAIDTSLTPFTLEPANIGSALNPDGSLMYPTPHFASIGDEYLSYTRSGDVITPTGRGLLGTPVDSHDEGETLQTSGVLENKKPSEILGALFSSTTLPTDYIQTEIFENNIDAYNILLYTGIVAEPTEVHQLIGEVMRDIGLSVYTDLINKRIFAEQIRPRQSQFEINDDILSKKQPSVRSDKRISAFYVRYGRFSPLEKLDEPKNYRSRLLVLNDDPNQLLQENSPEIRSHFSRWINSLQRQAASTLGNLMISRYKKNLRLLNCEIPTQFCPELGQIGNITTKTFVDLQGFPDTIKMQVIQVEKKPIISRVLFEEFNANFATPEQDIIVSLEYDINNANLRSIYNSIFSSLPDDESNIRFIALNGVIFGGVTDVGDWSEGTFNISIENLTMYGAQGKAGTPLSTDGKQGGTALYTRYNVEVINCLIAGGGGGGAGLNNYIYYTGGSQNSYSASGGSGAGRPKALINPGTDTLGHVIEELFIGGPKTGSGGDIGQAGEISSDGSSGPGNPGYSIDGVSFVTNTGSTFLGSTIN